MHSLSRQIKLGRHSEAYSQSLISTIRLDVPSTQIAKKFHAKLGGRDNDLANKRWRSTTKDMQCNYVIGSGWA